VVSNWDIGLTEQLERLGVASLFTAIVTTAEAGAPKPEPAVFRLALEKLGVDAGRALHVGDEPGDEDGARAAGMQFAPTPLATAFAGWS
jgi:putative hydrolase of the HAD superfamily